MLFVFLYYMFGRIFSYLMKTDKTIVSVASNRQTEELA